MKILVIIYVIFFWHCQIFCHDEIKVTNLYNHSDSLEEIPKTEDNLDLDIIFKGGLGITTGSTWGEWGETFNIGPAMQIGFEIPFTSMNLR